MGRRIFNKKIDVVMLKAISTIPLDISFRLLGRPRVLPMNLTISVTNKCNFKCKTCNIAMKKDDELSLQEWQRVFQKYGKRIFWATFSGGEPFLRNDLAEIVCSFYDSCRPKIINIPTNGYFSNVIPRVTESIARRCVGSQIILNISLDDIEEKHDSIRGMPGSYRNVLTSFRSLKSMKLANVSIGFHTVISRFNVQRIPQIYAHVRTLDPDSYVAEIAEERVELNTIGSDISPDNSLYSDAADFLISNLKFSHFNRVGKITRAFRKEYYTMTKKVLTDHRQIIPCYSGFASAQIAPTGDVWFCCIKADSIGNLRDVDYEFKRIWRSEKAHELRKRIKHGECFCPLANVSYTNIIHNIPALAKVAGNLIAMR